MDLICMLLTRHEGRLNMKNALFQNIILATVLCKVFYKPNMKEPASLVQLQGLILIPLIKLGSSRLCIRMGAGFI